jgi:hypothetical protein
MSVSGYIRDQAAEHAAFELDESARRARVAVVRAARTPEQLRERLGRALDAGDMRLGINRVQLAGAACDALIRMDVGWDRGDVAAPPPMADLPAPTLQKGRGHEMSRYACQDCGAHPQDGALILRVSPKGEPFQGKCEECLRALAHDEGPSAS